MDYSDFISTYANVPEKLRQEIVVVINGEPYTWKAAYLEISNDTTLGRAIFNKLKEMEII